MANILVVDDEIGIRELLSEILGDEGHQILLAENAAQARQQRQNENPDLVLLDIWMPDTDGVSLLKEWASNGQLTMPVIMMSGHATIDTAVEATRIGALDFLEKPIALQKLLKSVQQGLERARAPVLKMPTMLRPTPQPSTSNLSAPPPNNVIGLTGLSTSATLPAPTQPSPHLNQPVSAPPATLPNLLGQPGMIAEHGLHNNVATHHGPISTVLPVQMPHLPITLELPLRDARDEFERIYFEYHLARENGSMTRVAEKTGLERTHLYRKLKQLGVDLARAKARS